MAVNKNFVVKNGLEVRNDLVVAISTSSQVGIGTSLPAYSLDVFGGIGVTDARISGFATVDSQLRVGTGGTVLSVLAIDGKNDVGIGTTNPIFLLDVRSPTSTGSTAVYIQGDVRITGDLSVGDDITYDEVVGRNLLISGVGSGGTLNVASGFATDITVSGASTFTGIGTFLSDAYVGGNLYLDGGVSVETDLYIIGIATIGTLAVSGTGTASNFQVSGITTTNQLNVTGVGTLAQLRVSGASTLTGIVTTGGDLWVGGDLYVADDIVYDEVSGRNLNISGIGTFNNVNVTGVATIANLVGYSSSFMGAVGLQSAGTLIGAAVTTLNIVGGSSTVTMSCNTGTIHLPQAGVSLGLAIALGG